MADLISEVQKEVARIREMITVTKEFFPNGNMNFSIYEDVLRATNGKHIRAGKGKSRGRKYKIPKSILII